MPEIPPALLSTGGPWALVGLTFFFVLAGRLLPRSQHEDRIGDMKDRIAFLEQTVATRDEQIRVRDEQVQKLLPNTDLAVQLLRGLAKEAGRDDLVA